MALPCGNGTSMNGILNPAVTQMFARHLVYDNLFSCLTPASFARMSGLCRDVREAAMDFATRAYDINRSLSHYFSDPLAFRQLMARTYILISGSFALQFFDRTFFPGSDLDLYIHHDVCDSCENILEIGRWLEGEGYAYTPGPGQESTLDWQVQELQVVDDINQSYGEGLAIADVFTFEKHCRGDLGEDATVRKVQLVIPSSKHSSPLETILNFHSTCVINVITHDVAYSLYPFATFELSSALVLTRDESARTYAALEKYASRGFRMLDPRSLASTYDTQEVASFFMGRHRRVDDRNSWVIPLKKASKDSAQSSRGELGRSKHGQDDNRTRKGSEQTHRDHLRRDDGVSTKYVDAHNEYDDDAEEYEANDEDYGDEDDECGEDEDASDEDWNEDRDPISECRWRLRGDLLPLRVSAIDYVGARDKFWDEY